MTTATVRVEMLILAMVIRIVVTQRLDRIVPIALAIVANFVDLAMAVVAGLHVMSTWLTLRLLREEVLSSIFVTHDTLHTARHVDGIPG